MPIVLNRVDERLIHGQVVVGWGSKLRLERFVVVDEALAGNDWEQELYTLGVPEGAEALFQSPEEARVHLEEWRESALRTILLTPDIETMLEVARGGRMEGEKVNLGGLHFKTGRTAVLPYLLLSQVDGDALRELALEGVAVFAQDLPGSPKVGLETLLD